MAGASSRVVDELRELHARTGNRDGAQRVCWTETWARGRDWLRRELSELPVILEVDEAGNLWSTLRGQSPRAVLIGGHIDSVPNGGWLDGALNVLGGLEVLRRIASEGIPPVTVRLVDWADEEGARFGRSLLGSSACSGTLDPDEIRSLRDRDGAPLPEVLTQFGVDLDQMLLAHRQLATAAAYVELHIEQGPVLEQLGLPLGVVQGTYGVERHAVCFSGQASHAGSSPMGGRRDAFAAAARLTLSVRESAKRAGGLATVGHVRVRPDVPTAIAGECEISLDQRHLDADVLRSLLSDARTVSARIAAEENVFVKWHPIWRVDPVPFSTELIRLANEAVRETVGSSHLMWSGPLHDAAEIARAHIPTVMIFVQSLRGLSHTKEEDTRPEHLMLAVEALDRLTRKTMDWIRFGP